jgi:microcystin-dependent protein
MSDQFVAEIRIFAGNFAPNGWARTDGQTLSISQNTALFTLLGTMYGGDGRSTFALPDFRGRVPVQQGQGAGLSARVQGQSGGSPTFGKSSVPTAATPAAPIQAITFTSAPISTQSPYLALTFIIALQGIFPPRD